MFQLAYGCNAHPEVMPCPIKRRYRCASLCASALTFIVFSILKVRSVDELYLQPFYMHDDSQPTHQQEGCNWIPNQRWPLHCKKKKKPTKQQLLDCIMSSKQEWPTWEAGWVEAGTQNWNSLTTHQADTEQPLHALRISFVSTWWIWVK